MSEYAVICDALVKSFGEAKILKGLNMKIHKGKITTILGFSGAGKSTLLKHILGLLQPTSGTITVLDKNMGEMSELELRNFRTNFGMLFQYAALFDSMSAFKNVEFPLIEFTKMTPEERKVRVEKLLNSVGLDPLAFHRLPSELSGGMRKRVGLARALALKPKIILYDEPTTGLDPITTHMVNDLIKQTAREGESYQLTSIIISHDIHATLRISDYVAFLEQGQVVEHSAVEKFKQSQNPIIRSFLELSH